MKTVQISLNSIDKVKSFVNSITQFDFDFDLISGRYVIDRTGDSFRGKYRRDHGSHQTVLGRVIKALAHSKPSPKGGGLLFSHRQGSA